MSTVARVNEIKHLLAKIRSFWFQMGATKNRCSCRVLYVSKRRRAPSRLSVAARTSYKFSACAGKHTDIKVAVSMIIKTLQTPQQQLTQPPEMLCVVIATLWLAVRAGGKSVGIRGSSAWKNFTAFVYMYIDDARAGHRLESTILTGVKQWKPFISFVAIGRLDVHVGETKHGWYTRRRNRYKASLLQISTTLKKMGTLMPV